MDDYVLSEQTLGTKVLDPCIFVIFGVTGDLTGRKLIPALYNLSQEALLPSHFACVGFARRDKTNEQFRKECYESTVKFSRTKPESEQAFEAFANHLYYHRSNFDEDAGYLTLKAFLEKLDKELGTKGNRIFYLSTQPSYFPEVVEKLKKNGLIYAHDEKEKFSRVVIEKPFGHDYESAMQLQEKISHYLDENQIYRIDHYLGKETVQNLLYFRFANPIFEDLWNNHYIDHLQITVAEEIGIGTRGKFWEETGFLRDIVQNHMMQLLSLTLMEPPVHATAEAIRDEKVKVLKAIEPMTSDEVDHNVIRAQYSSGFINGSPVVGYREEENVPKDSSVETYLALKLFVNNWRWSGVPIYLRGGKRLTRRATEIAITFKSGANPFSQKGIANPNVLVIHIQPNEGISLKINSKVPGLTQVIQPVKMDFKYVANFGGTPPEAYERLIYDCIAGDSTLFARYDEVIRSWEIMTPILNHWKEHQHPTFYESGSQGPKEANQLIENDGRTWRLI
jgi:glucose-6-phosphate 1-dehydrogenase